MDSDVVARTDEAGHAAAEVGAGLAGYCSAVDPPLPIPHPALPAPDKPAILYLWVQQGNGIWSYQELEVRDDQIIGSDELVLYIELGSVTVATPG